MSTAVLLLLLTDYDYVCVMGGLYVVSREYHPVKSLPTRPPCWIAFREAINSTSTCVLGFDNGIRVR